MIYKGTQSQTQELLITLIGSVPYGIISINNLGNVTLCNLQALELLELDYELNQLIDQPVLGFIEEIDEVYIMLNESIENDCHAFELEEIILGEKYLKISGTKISSGLIISIQDISDLKKTEQEMLNVMLEGQEQERRRLAREIHDGIGPLLSAIKLNIGQIETDLEQNESPSIRDFSKAYTLIDEVTNDLRSISHNLMPKTLLDFGLMEALEAVCEKIRFNKKILVDFIYSHKSLEMTENDELSLYRIIQELINNTLKHAKASKITLQIMKQDEVIFITYEDNGLGFDQDKEFDGIGLSNIESRVSALSGQIEISSFPQKGMTASIEIPLTQLYHAN